MILLVDNYDSFTWNVAQLLGELGAEVEVARNDTITLADVERMAPAGIVISPGPGGPADAGVSLDVIRSFGPRTPLLGICLGMQCIGALYGATVARAGELVHGQASAITHDGRGVFSEVPTPFAAGRYHSLALVEDTIPAELEVTARAPHTEANPRGIVMGVRHRVHPVEGVQFHPESILTEHGHKVLANYLDVVRASGTGAAA